MATEEELQKQLDDLNKARFSGVKQVQHGDKSVTNRSIAEMRAAAADLQRELDRASGTRRNRQIRIVTNRGL